MSQTQWLKSIILATFETENERIIPGQKAQETQSQAMAEHLVLTFHPSPTGKHE
jgi:hypothetical protein